MHKITKKLNNRGASLIMVIVCMLFIGIIASIVIIATRNNFLNINSQINSTENFYTAENAIDDLKTKLEEYADDALKLSYSEWLQQYSYLSKSEQDRLFKTLFIAEFETIVTDTIFPAGGSVVALCDLLGDDFTSENIQWVGVPVIENKGEELVLRISVKYVEPDGTASTISTDLCFTIDDPDFQIGTTAGLNENCADYAIIADETVTNGSADGVINAGSMITIAGNVYGGGYDRVTGDYADNGFKFENADGVISIYSDKLVTRTSISVENGANVVLKGSDRIGESLGRPSYTDIWAKNMSISGTGTPMLAIQGKCYISDDLTLDAQNARFLLMNAGSEYYGYGANEVSGKPENSSAIIINGKSPYLDLSQAGKVVIAGKSFISVPAKFGYKDVYDTLLQGESLAYIGQQAAYMLPSECIMGVGHNPMTEEDFAKLTEADGKTVITTAAAAEALGKNAYVDISQCALNGGVALENYVSSANPVKVMYVNYSGVNMIYLYLNFKDSDSASQYFADFATYYQALVEGRMSTFGGTIKINPDVISSTGNVLSTATSVSGAAAKLVNERTATSGSSDLVMNQWLLSTKYTGLTSNLNEEYMGLGSQQFLTNNIVNMNLAGDEPLTVNFNPGTEDESYLGTFRQGIMDAQYYLYTGSSVTVNCNTSGIIISSGDVTVNGNFTGLIVARGNVFLKGTASVTADKDNILHIIRDTANKANEYFAVQSATAGTGTGGTIIASDLINVEYKNWSKR